jgi:cell division protein FtsB
VSARAAAPSPAATRGRTAGAPPGGRAAKRRTHLTPRAAVLLFTLLVLGLFAISPIRSYFAQRAQLAALEHQAEDLDQQVRDLRSQIAGLNDPSTLERLARECLGMVRPGQIAFVTIPKHAAPTPPDCS